MNPIYSKLNSPIIRWIIIGLAAVILLAVPATRYIILFNALPLLILALIVAVIMRFTPGTHSTKIVLAAITGLGFLIHAYNFTKFGVILDVDSLGYINFAREFSQRHGFPGMIFRAPLYPFLLGLTFIAGSTSLVPIVIFQHLVLVIAIPSVYLLTRMIGCNERTGIIASLLFTINTIIIPAAGWVMTEAIYLILILLCALVLMIFNEKPSLLRAIGLGALFSLTSHLRPGIEPLFAVSLLVPVYLHRMKILMFIGIAVAAFLICNAPWSIRNFNAFHTYALSQSTGVHLFTKAFSYRLLDTSGKSFKAIEQPYMHSLADLKITNDSWTRTLEDVWAINAFPHALRDSLMAYHGCSYMKADRLLAQASIEGIRSHPAGYVAAMGKSLATLLFKHREIYPSAEKIVPNHFLKILHVVPERIIRGFIYVPGIFFILFPVYLFLRRKFLTLQLVPFLIGITGLVSVSLVEVGLTRYTIPWIPFWIICTAIMADDAIAGLVALISKRNSIAQSL